MLVQFPTGVQMFLQAQNFPVYVLATCTEDDSFNSLKLGHSVGTLEVFTFI